MAALFETKEFRAMYGWFQMLDMTSIRSKAFETGTITYAQKQTLDALASQGPQTHNAKLLDMVREPDSTEAFKHFAEAVKMLGEAYEPKYKQMMGILDLGKALSTCFRRPCESTDGLATAPTSDGPAIPPLEPGEGYGVAVFSFNPQSKGPRAAEGYNTLNAALSDLNEAISSLEGATISSQPQPEPVAQPQSNSKQLAAVAVIADKVEVTQQDESTDGLATAPTSDGPAIPPLEPGEGYGVAVFSFNPQSKRELTLRKGDDIILIRNVDANWMEGKVGSGSKGIFPRTYVKVFLAPTVVAQRGKSPAAKTPEPAAQPTSSGSDVGSSTSTSSSNATNSQPVQTREKKAENQQGSAKARFSFQAENVRELSLTKGEEVTLLRKVDNNWYEATLGPGIKGIVPTTYLEIVEDVPLMDKRVSGKWIPIEGEDPGTNQASRPMPASPQKELTGERFVAVYPYASQNEDELELGEGDIVYVVEQCTDGWFVGTSERTRDFGTFPGNYVTAA